MILSGFPEDPVDDIRQTLDRLNRAWLERRFDLLGDCFADDIVMRGPTLKPIIRGRAALVKSYADFMERSTVITYAEANHSVDCWDSVGAATYDWDMTWEQEGNRQQHAGQEMIVFERRDQRWIAVLRLMLF